MSVTIAAQPNNPAGVSVFNTLGDLKLTVTNVTGDASYPTGGYALTAAQLGLPESVLFAVTSVTTASAAAVSEAFYNLATGKLQLFTATAEVANAVNVSAIVVQIVAFGD